MKLIRSLVSGGVEGIGNAVAGVARVFVGDKGAREAAGHNREMAVTGQYAAEFRQMQSRTWFDALVDGLNRLVRPAFVGSVIYLWATLFSDPTYFGEIAVSLKLVPPEMWGLTGVIVTFYFAGRPFEKAAERRSNKQLMDTVTTVVEARKKLRTLRSEITPGVARMEDETFQREMSDDSKPMTNAAIMEWNRRSASDG